MALYFEINSTTFREWHGEIINGIRYPLVIEDRWSDEKLLELGLHKPKPADPVPSGFIIESTYVARVDGIVKYVNILKSINVSTDHVHPNATVAVGGFMSAADRAKLEDIETEATKNEGDSFLLNRANHIGSMNADNLVDGVGNKVFSAAEKTKLGGIATGATANASDASLRDRGTHTGSQSADTITDGAANKVFTALEKAKLSDIAAGATANAADSALRDRSTHTGTQSMETIVNLVSALAEKIEIENVPVYSTADAVVAGGIPDTPAFQTRGFRSAGIGPGLFVNPVSSNPNKGDYIQVTVQPISGPAVQRWYREAQETGTIDIARHGLYGDAPTNNTRNETVKFLDAIAVMADRGLKGISSPGGRGYKVIQGEIPVDVEIDMGGSVIYGEFGAHQVGNNYTLNCLFTQEVNQRKVAIKNTTFHGQNNSGVVMQGGEPILFLRGGEVVLEKVNLDRGANRKYTGGVNPVPANKNDSENAEILIRNAKRVTIDSCDFRASPGEMVQIVDDYRRTVVQVLRSYFTKKRHNGGLWSSSGLNVFNALHTLLWANTFDDFIKGATNIESERSFALFNIIRRVSDSNGLDFCEARTIRNNHIYCYGNHLEDIVGVGIRGSASNFVVDGNSYNRVNICTSNEGDVVAGTSGDTWIKDDPQPLYNFNVRNQMYMDWDPAHTDRIGVRALGASGMPVHVTLDGNDIKDRPDASTKKARYGFWGQHSELVARGRHSVGTIALIYQTGSTKLHLEHVQFGPETGESLHCIELNGAVVPIAGIIGRNIKRPDALDAGYYDIRNTSSTLDLKAIQIYNSPDFPATSNNAVIWRDSKLPGTLAYAGATITNGTGVTLTVPVTGARLGDEAYYSIPTGNAGGLTISAAVSAANEIKVRIQNQTGADVIIPAVTVTAGARL